MESPVTLPIGDTTILEPAGSAPFETSQTHIFPLRTPPRLEAV